MQTADPVRRTVEIEDLTNLLVVHPIANRLVPVCARLGIPPNAVSIAGMVCGVLAGVAYAHYQDVRLAVAGFLLMLAWHVLDGVDGQLARLTRSQSQSGKILDGICDYVTFTAVYIGLALVLGRQQGAWVWGLVVVSGACHAVQSALYEVQRQEYEFWGRGRASAALPEPPSPLAAHAGPGRAIGFGDRLHAVYLRVQLLGVGIAGKARQRLAASLRQDPERAGRVRLLYRQMFAAPVRRWSMLSANTRTLGIFVCALALRPLVYFYLEIFGLSAGLAILLVLQRRRVGRFMALLTTR